MKIIDVDGIVLNDTNYSESSKILNVLTKEYGLIGVMNKGCRNIKSKLSGVSRKLVYGTFHIYYKEKGLSTLIGVDIINDFSNIEKDLMRISYASYILDLTHILEVKFFDYLGVKPSLYQCTLCGNSDDIVTLSSSSGGLVCGSCHTDEALVNIKSVQMIRMYYYVDIDKITKLDVSDEVKNDINNFLDDYYERYTGLYLKSKDFIKKVNMLN